MTVLTFFLLLLFFSFLAGLLGALTGLGGGVVVIPVLILLFHIDIHFAMGAALISVLATASGTATAYLRQGLTNLRIGMFLETAAVIGALCGALLVPFIPVTFLTVLLSFVLFFSAYLTFQRKEEHEQYHHSHPWAVALKLDGCYTVKSNLEQRYYVQHVPQSLCIMGIAGLLAGLLGIGSGTLKVLAMDQALRLPYKVATTTSNFMIGITAATTAGIYFSHGYIAPAIAFPVMLGVLAGSFIGAKLLIKIHTKTLRLIFSIIICFIGLQLIYNAFFGAS